MKTKLRKYAAYAAFTVINGWLWAIAITAIVVAANMHAGFSADPLVKRYQAAGYTEYSATPILFAATFATSALAITKARDKRKVYYLAPALAIAITIIAIGLVTALIIDRSAQSCKDMCGPNGVEYWSVRGPYINLNGSITVDTGGTVCRCRGK
ncbi:hypothetical protein [Thermofilum pendens]|uniref:Uncharacterized protein n=1 Tax=Thermofilum pendens (strain DSM 2475 / Hrk 5) TaxID=368408 RepID=A1RZU8_THEPD|nr:hypothetical protein [Thermofilum pendens]ABL78728.1 hypothetical protein Tpen_1331 [Thermofilum pendens Hrk 5]